jgi:hypothetical protein
LVWFWIPSLAWFWFWCLFGSWESSTGCNLDSFGFITVTDKRKEKKRWWNTNIYRV